MLEAAVGAVWSGARGWLTPPVLFVFINLVIGTIAVMSRLMSSSGDGGDQRSLMRAPSVAFDRLRCFSFSRLGLPADHAAFDGGAAETASSPVHPAPDGGEWRRMSLLRRAPSAALDRIRGFSFSRRGPVADHAPVTQQELPSDGATDAEPLSSLRPKPAEAAGMERDTREHEQAGIERSQSEAAAEAPARRRPRARRTGMGRTEERADGHGMATGVGEGGAEHHEPPAVEVDARADDFIRQFREQLRLQRLDSILRYKDTLRRTGTV